MYGNLDRYTCGDHFHYRLYIFVYCSNLRAHICFMKIEKEKENKDMNYLFVVNYHKVD